MAVASALEYIYDDNTKSFRATPKDDDKDRIEVEIGDSKRADFYPQLKLMRWDNEVNGSFRFLSPYTDSPVYLFDQQQNKIIWKQPKLEIHYYDIPVGNKNCSEGGYEYEIILLEKPPTNVLEFSINTKELDYLYQPEISDEEAQYILDNIPTTATAEELNVIYYGHIPTTIGEAKRWARPIDVLGSYAVYHKTKSNNFENKHYKVGKAFHIYRPRIRDSVGNEVWGELSVDTQNELLTVNIPQGFLDKAIYPVYHAAGLLFGYDTYGTSSTNFANAMFGSVYTGAAGTGDSMTWAGYGWAAKIYHCAIYLDSTSTKITNGETGTDNGSGAWEWQAAIAFSTGPTVSAVSYVLVSGGAEDLQHYVRYDGDGANQGKREAISGGVFPSSVASWDDESARKYSIYCTYSVAAAEEQPPYLTLLKVG